MCKKVLYWEITVRLRSGESYQEQTDTEAECLRLLAEIEEFREEGRDVWHLSLGDIETGEAQSLWVRGEDIASVETRAVEASDPQM